MNKLDLSDEAFELMIENGKPLYETYIKKNKDLTHADVAMLRQLYDSAMNEFDSTDRIKYIYLKGEEQDRVYRFTILDDEFITGILSHDLEWEEKRDWYHPSNTLNIYDAFIIQGKHGDIYAGSYLQYKLNANDIKRAVDMNRFTQVVGPGSVVYSVGINWAKGEPEAKLRNEIDSLLYVLSGLGYWNLATVHMREYQSKKLLRKNTNSYILYAVNAIRNGSTGITFEERLGLRIKMVLDTDGTLTFFSEAYEPLNFISSHELEDARTSKLYRLGDNLDHFLKINEKLGLKI